MRKGVQEDPVLVSTSELHKDVVLFFYFNLSGKTIKHSYFIEFLCRDVKTKVSRILGLVFAMFNPMSNSVGLII